MLTAMGQSIRLRDPHRHKYGDAIAEWLDHHIDYADEMTGDVDWDVFIARFGRTLLIFDDRGFVERVTYTTEQMAIEQYGLLDEQYCQWAFDEE